MTRNRNNLALAWVLAALVFLTATLLAGLLYSLQFIQLYPFAGIEFFSPGRWRVVHTQGVLWGFVMNASLGGLHWLMPRWTGRPILSRAMGWTVFGCWQAVLAVGLASAAFGSSEPVRWNEVSVVPDAGRTILLVLLAMNILKPLVDAWRHGSPAARCMLFGIVLAGPVDALGNLVPRLLDDPAGMALAAYAGKAVPGLVLRLLAWGLASGLATVVTNRPLWRPRWLGAAIVVSSGLWLAGGVWVISGRTGPTGSAAVIVGVIDGLVSLSVAINVGMTLLGSARTGTTTLVGRWLLAGALCYAVASLQGIVQEVPPIAEFIRFTDSQIGHSHLLVFGAFGLWSLGAMTLVLLEWLNAPPWSRASWSELHFWLSVVGLLVMWAVLAVVGPFQAFLWGDRIEWAETIVASSPAWLCRTLAGGMIILGHVVLLTGLACTLHRQGRGWRIASVIAAATAMVVAIGLITARWLPTVRFGQFFTTDAVTCLAPPAGLPHELVGLAEAFPAPFRRGFGDAELKGLEAAAALGREVYIREGCWQCHTQSVRPTGADMLRWGAATDSASRGGPRDPLSIPGFRRIGPDLSGQADRRANDWHLAHLYNPLGPSPVSVMPAYPWLFDGQGLPTEQGLAVMAYLQRPSVAPAALLSSSRELR